jgi:opacity protein-like surface antigen
VKTLVALAAALLAAACASAPRLEPPAQVPADLPSSALAIHLGVRGLDDHDWDPVDDQGTIGLELVHEAPGSIVGLEAAFFASQREEDDFHVTPSVVVDARGRTSEIDFGVHKTIPVEYGGVRPYLGGGFSVLHADLRGEANGAQARDDADSVGVYLHGGVEFDLSPNLYLGLDLRARGGSEVHLLGDDVDTGYGQVTLALGVRL